ncbi:MAG: bifunctional glutamate N-acetyltransferase/amino-acid acetyltransferase ArgJ [Actinobacteria bacterium]|nr:bifunctional glutamate N-acetyltransferase/amino-acid acetyltransferase ArgJ [Actinomycetota bacterium]
MSHVFRDVGGGVCATPGIEAAGVAAGLRRGGGPDVALVVAPAPVTAAAVQTRNQVAAAPVVVTRRHVADGRARAVLLNAGYANACTGPDGMAVATDSAAEVGRELGCGPADVLVCSTGVIGEPLPRESLLGAIPRVAAALDASGGRRAAEAILTTDTVAKQVAVGVDGPDGGCVVGGMAKGAGMIAPGLATMLCVVTTDAALPAPRLRALLGLVADRTFGRVSVDGCMSTNDAVVVLATGGAARPPPEDVVAEALARVCGRLAEWLARDGEGARTLVRVRVAEAPDEPAAVAVARAVADSALFRAAIAGADPNWGRVLAAIGAGPVRVDPDRIGVDFAGVPVCRDGVAAPFDRSHLAALLEGPEVDVTVRLGLGDGRATVTTCDLTHGYVTINAEYTT